MAKLVACLGDTSSHGGEIISTNQDGTFIVDGIAVAVDQAVLRCGNPLHGDRHINANTVKTMHNGKLIVCEGAEATCGAVIQPTNRRTYVE